MPSRERIDNTGLSRLSLIIAALLVSIAALALMKGVFDPPRELKGEALIRALKGGGYTLLFRHTARATNVTEFNDLIVLADCSTQIPLTELGRAQARAIGEAMRKLRIPIGETLASPFCRTMETARLIAGNARADNAVLGHAGGSFQNTMNFTPLIDIMATPPQPGTNRIIVGHSSAFDNVAGGPSLEQGESGIFRIVDRRPVLVARVLLEEWQAYLSSSNGDGAKGGGAIRTGALGKN
jgi:phosphohistidine phosphatase SixA